MTALEDLAAKAAGPAVETIDVQAVNAKEKRSLYKKRVKIHPKRVQGSFRRLKWIIMAVTLGIYYLAPWIRWDRGANAPDQAILIDFPARRFYFFFIEIWPQEVYYLTGLLILAALALFLITALAGRVWCGYTCPQTVWTDLFVAVERFVEGDRNARLKLDRAHWNATKISKRVVKHTIWLLIAVATGGAWIFYFADAPRLAGQLVSFDAPAVAYVFIAVFTFTTYALGGDRARAGLHLHVSLAPDPGRDVRRGFLPDQLSRFPRRLQSVRRRLPDGYRHPRRRSTGMHPVRSLYRRLRQRHGQGRPAPGADRLRHLSPP
jgi:hypothetical protein